METRDRQGLEDYKRKSTVWDEYVTNQSLSPNNWKFDEQDVYETP